MEERRTTILTLHEIENGYLLTYTDARSNNPQTRSFQWDASNDQRLDLIKVIVNRLGMKHDISVERR